MSVACKLQYKRYVITMSVACRLVQYVSLCMGVFVISLSVVHLTEEHQPVLLLFSVSGDSECGNIREMCRACLLLWL